jgi:hypothetical protein
MEPAGRHAAGGAGRGAIGLPLHDLRPAATGPWAVRRVRRQEG